MTVINVVLALLALAVVFLVYERLTLGKTASHEKLVDLEESLRQRLEALEALIRPRP